MALESAKREMIMSYRYRAFLQAVDVYFFREDQERTFKIICEAEIKLPLFKKEFSTSTEFNGGYSNWIQHWPVHEKGLDSKKVQRDQFGAADVIDPIGFFMRLDEAEWPESSVHLLVGAKSVHLDVLKVNQGLEVRRREKDQKLILKKDAQGIQKIEVPIPVIGNIVVERNV